MRVASPSPSPKGEIYLGSRLRQPNRLQSDTTGFDSSTTRCGRSSRWRAALGCGPRIRGFDSPRSPHMKYPFIYFLHNKERLTRGIPKFIFSGDISRTCQNHVDAMMGENKLFHANSDDLLSDIMKATPNANYWGENIGVGPSQRAIFKAFMNSPAHRDNILNRHFTKIGIAKKRDSEGRLWVCVRFSGIY